MLVIGPKFSAVWTLVNLLVPGGTLERFMICFLDIGFFDDRPHLFVRPLYHAVLFCVHSYIHEVTISAEIYYMILIMPLPKIQITKF